MTKMRHQTSGLGCILNYKLIQNNLIINTDSLSDI